MGVESGALVLGYERYLIELYEHPKLIHDWNKRVVEANIAYLRAQESITGTIDRLVVTDHLPGQVGQAHCEEFIYPYLKDIFDAFSSAAFRLYHNENLVPDAAVAAIADMNCTVFMFGIEMDIAAEHLGGRVCLMGNVPPIHVVQQLEPPEITSDCLDRLAVGAPSGGMLLCTAGGLSPDTPADHIRAFADSVEGIPGAAANRPLTGRTSTATPWRAAFRAPARLPTGLGSVSFASGRRPVPANPAGSALMADRLKVMVTGATGKIGQTLMEDLPDGFEVTGTSRSSNDDPRFIQLDFDDVDTIAQPSPARTSSSTCTPSPTTTPTSSSPTSNPTSSASGTPTKPPALPASAASSTPAPTTPPAGTKSSASAATPSPSPDPMASTAPPRSGAKPLAATSPTATAWKSSFFGSAATNTARSRPNSAWAPASSQPGSATATCSTWSSGPSSLPASSTASTTASPPTPAPTGTSPNAVSELGYRPVDNAEEYADEVLPKGGVYSLWDFEVPGMT